jgi:hypothetical protein
VQELIEAGYRFELLPVGGTDDRTFREVYYAVQVPLEGLTAARLTQLLAIVDGFPYDGQMRSGALLLEARRS